MTRTYVCPSNSTKSIRLTLSRHSRDQTSLSESSSFQGRILVNVFATGEIVRTYSDRSADEESGFKSCLSGDMKKGYVWWRRSIMDEKG